MAETYFGITDTGKMRDNNEDAFIAEPVLKGKYIAACAIDGVGGYEGGEVAAAIARKSILNYLSIPSGEVKVLMREALVSANENIVAHKSKNPELASMACVATLALVDEAVKTFYYAHVGDTRLYLFRDNSLVKITKDHSFVGFLEDSGRLTEEAAMAHPKRNEINKALGFEAPLPTPAEYIETGESPFLPGDILLLCSDGLSDLVNNANISAVLGAALSLEEKGNKLITAANNAGGKDNITVVLVQNNTKPAKLKATKPVIAVKKNERPQNKPAPVSNVQTPVVHVQQKQRSSVAVWALSVLCLLLTAALIWLVWGSKKVEPTPVSTAPVVYSRQPGEQQFITSLHTGDTVRLSGDSATIITITDSILLQGDTVIIIGNNTTLLGDSSLQGPALYVSQEAKYVLLQHVHLQNMTIQIPAQNSNALRFKNVTFLNVHVSVMHSLSTDSLSYTGALPATQKPKADSLSKKQ